MSTKPMSVAELRRLAGRPAAGPVVYDARRARIQLRFREEVAQATERAVRALDAIAAETAR